MSAAAHRYEVCGVRSATAARIFDVVTDQVRMPGGEIAARDYLRHVGAVGVVALDDAGPGGPGPPVPPPGRAHLWELPAGLMDVAGEEPLVATAARELAEEADLTAGRWDTLVDLHTSPGCSRRA